MFSPLVCSPPIIPQQMGSPEILIFGGEREHGERSYERCNRESF